VGDRLVAMAQFVRKYALNPADGLSGAYISFDTGEPVYIPNTPIYTAYWCDTLVRGYRLTGDQALLERAKLHWHNGTEAKDRSVGRFVNRYWLSDTPFYLGNGELTYASLMFYDEANAAH